MATRSSQMLAAAALLACAVAVPLASDHQILDAQVSAHSIALDDDIGESLSAVADAAAMLHDEQEQVRELEKEHAETDWTAYRAHVEEQLQSRTVAELALASHEDDDPHPDLPLLWRDTVKEQEEAAVKEAIFAGKEVVVTEEMVSAQGLQKFIDEFEVPAFVTQDPIIKKATLTITELAKIMFWLVEERAIIRTKKCYRHTNALNNCSGWVGDKDAHNPYLRGNTEPQQNGLKNIVKSVCYPTCKAGYGSIGTGTCSEMCPSGSALNDETKYPGAPKNSAGYSQSTIPNTCTWKGAKSISRTKKCTKKWKSGRGRCRSYSYSCDNPDYSQKFLNRCWYTWRKSGWKGSAQQPIVNKYTRDKTSRDPKVGYGGACTSPGAREKSKGIACPLGSNTPWCPPGTCYKCSGKDIASVTACPEDCPEGLINCGRGMCALDRATCASAIAKMITAPITLAVNLATFGAGGAAAKGASSTAKSVKFAKYKKMATDSVDAFKTALGGEAKIKKMKKLNKLAGYVGKVGTPVRTAVDKQMEAADEQIDELINPTANRMLLRYFGYGTPNYKLIARTVGWTMQALAVLEMVKELALAAASIADPTGVVDCVAAFAHGKCKQHSEGPMKAMGYPLRAIGKLHHVTSCKQCTGTRNLCAESQENKAKGITSEMYDYTSVNLASWGCDKLTADTLVVRPKQGNGVFVVERPPKVGKLHEINNCKQCGGTRNWCKEATTNRMNGITADLYDSSSVSLAAWGCDKLSSETIAVKPPLGASSKGNYVVEPYTKQGRLHYVENCGQCTTMYLSGVYLKKVNWCARADSNKAKGITTESYDHWPELPPGLPGPGASKPAFNFTEPLSSWGCDESELAQCGCKRIDENSVAVRQKDGNGVFIVEPYDVWPGDPIIYDGNDVP